jgi:hypothetical protein
MIKFSWKKINDKFDWNAPSVLEYFFLIRDLKVPAYLHRKIPKLVKQKAMEGLIAGPCFLINPDAALTGAVAPNDLYMYLELASKRNIFDYTIRKVKHLPLVLVEEYQLQWIEINPMMEIKNNNIYFKYEQEKKQNDY